MFEIMKNLISDNSNRKFIPYLDVEVINVFCHLYGINVCDNECETLEGVKNFIKGYGDVIL